MYNLIGVVIVDYGPDPELLKGCLESIKNTGHDVKICVIDNNLDNIGYGAACNVGFHKLKNDCKFILFLNNDVQIKTKGFFKELFFSFEDTRADVVCPTTIDIMNYSGKMNFSGPRKSLSDRFCYTPFKNIKTDFIYGAAFAVRSESFYTIFDPRFFLYYEDVDFSHQCKNNGCNVVTSRGAMVVHSNNHKKKYSPLTRYYQARNILLCYKKNFSAVKWCLFLIYFYAYFVQKRLIFFVLTGKFMTARYFIAGIMDFYKGETGQCQIKK